MDLLAAIVRPGPLGGAKNGKSAIVDERFWYRVDNRPVAGHGTARGWTTAGQVLNPVFCDDFSSCQGTGDNPVCARCAPDSSSSNHAALPCLRSEYRATPC